MVSFEIYGVKSKGNQTIKSGQLEYNIRNIFLEKSYSKCSVEANPRPLSISWDQQSEML